MSNKNLDTEKDLTRLTVSRGKRTILLIDDEEMVRQIATSILKECGYSIISAKNGLEGIRIYNPHS